MLATFYIIVGIANADVDCSLYNYVCIYFLYRVLWAIVNIHSLSEKDRTKLSMNK